MRYIVLILFIVLILTGCITRDMKADTMRAAIDNCRDNNLDVQVYQRADRSIIDIRCLPKKGDVQHTVTIRKRSTMPLLRVLTENIDIVETD